MTAARARPGASVLARQAALATATAAAFAAVLVGFALHFASPAEPSREVERRVADAAASAARALERRLAEAEADLTYLARSGLVSGALTALEEPVSRSPADAGRPGGGDEAGEAGGASPDAGRRSPDDLLEPRRESELQAFAAARRLAELRLVSPAGELVYSLREPSDEGSARQATAGDDAAMSQAFRLARATPGEVVWAEGDPFPIAARAVPGADGGELGVIVARVALDGTLDAPRAGVRLVLLGADDRARLEAGPEAGDLAGPGTRVAPASPETAGRAPAFSLERALDVPGLNWRLRAEPVGIGASDPLAGQALTLAAAALAAVVAAVAFGWAAGRRMARPLKALAEASGGAPAVAPPSCERDDEIGVLARAINRLQGLELRNRQVESALAASDRMAMILDPEQRLVCATPALEAVLSPQLVQAEDGASAIPKALVERLQPGAAPKAGTGSGSEVELDIDGRSFRVSKTELRDRADGLLGELTVWRDAATGPQTRMGELLSALASGDFSGRVGLAEDSAEGRMAAALDQLRETAESFFGELASTADSLASGRLSARMQEDRPGGFGEAARRLNAGLARLSETLADIGGAAEGMGEAADEISGDAEALSGRTEAQASSLEETAATMEQMAANVKGTAENAANAEALAREAAAQAEAGRQVMSDAVAAMGRIEESSNRISDIISVIDGIAFQTNLLALNASVEAARAGEAGKGFAVVAGEVGQLAQRSRQAARDITGLIQDSAGHVGEGVRLVQGTGAALEEVADGIARTAETIAEISGAVQEQASGVQETCQAVSHMDEVTQSNSAMAERNAAAARRLQDETRWLVERVSFFKTGAASAARGARAEVAPAQAGKARTSSATQAASGAPALPTKPRAPARPQAKDGQADRRGAGPDTAKRTKAAGHRARTSEEAVAAPQNRQPKPDAPASLKSDKPDRAAAGRRTGPGRGRQTAGSADAARSDGRIARGAQGGGPAGTGQRPRPGSGASDASAAEGGTRGNAAAPSALASGDGAGVRPADAAGSRKRSEGRSRSAARLGQAAEADGKAASGPAAAESLDDQDWSEF